MRKWKAKKQYGLEPSELEELYARSGGRCEICGKNEQDDCGALCIDHNHATGAVRGLLCRNCNSAIGKLRDSPVLLGRAIKYLSERQP